MSIRLAMLSPIAWRTPPRHYGPWESVVSVLTEQLVRIGLEVTQFATGDSQTTGHLVAVCPRSYSEDSSVNPKVAECLHISEVFERASDFDLIHNHFDFLPLTYSALIETPVLRSHYVAISEADKSPELDYLATIHHGIDVAQFPFSDSGGKYLLFFGRIHPEKGVHEAIQVARRVKMKLLIAGIVQDQAYFERFVEPYLDGTTVEYLGAIGPDRRPALLGQALALLHLVSFNEPFGLSVVESMACGTPVIAFGRGSMPEIIRHGRTGYIVEDIDQAVDAVAAVRSIDRSACRDDVETRFSDTRMAQDYVRAYQEILEL
jgi:glycosyltransferase involved in cell wall biosynthesis